MARSLAWIPVVFSRTQKASETDKDKRGHFPAWRRQAGPEEWSLRLNKEFRGVCVPRKQRGMPRLVGVHKPYATAFPEKAALLALNTDPSGSQDTGSSAIAPQTPDITKYSRSHFLENVLKLRAQESCLLRPQNNQAQQTMTCN